MISKPNLKRVTILTPAEMLWEENSRVQDTHIKERSGDVKMASPRFRILTTLDSNRQPPRTMCGSTSPPTGIQFTLHKKRPDRFATHRSPNPMGFFSSITKPDESRLNSFLSPPREKPTMSMIQGMSRPRKYFKTETSPDKNMTISPAAKIIRNSVYSGPPILKATTFKQSPVRNDSDSESGDETLNISDTSAGRLDISSTIKTPNTAKSPLEKQLQAIMAPTMRFGTTRRPEGPREPRLSDFVKGKFLGKGKFGEVFVVKHKITGFVCALKVISKQVLRQQKMELQLVNELRIHMSCTHQNICNMYGFFYDRENIYILMELCSDGMLYGLIKKERRVSEKITAFIIKQICEGLKYLHQHGVVHRDIKPENIIVERGIIKICDFGWAAICKGSRRTICGTPLYFSPEIVKGKAYDQRTDLWAVGIMTYELIVGSIPFRIWTQMELNKIAEDDISFPSWVDVSENAQDFILRILKKNPEDRLSITKLLAHPFLAGVDLTESIKF